MSLDAYLAAQPDRCPHGFHLPKQGCTGCGVAFKFAADEWSTFVAALRQAAVGGVVHQAAVRPLIRGRIAPKHIGAMYRRAKSEGLLVEAGHDESDDHIGKNAGRLEPRYRLEAAS